MESPLIRPRRLRRTPALRRLVAETTLLRRDLIAPLFVSETLTSPAKISSLPGQFQHSATLLRYQEIAVAQAQAGADLVAPSGMMDGQVGAIRDALDGAGFSHVGILAYAVKYHSGLFGPFREAVDVSIVGGGNRSTYQQDPANRRESLREALLDVEQGADIVMVKPALTYLDVISDVASAVDVPVAAYHVSGEYAMVKAAAERGWIDGDAVALEQLTAVKRAGADMILTYFAREIAGMLDG